MAEPKVDMVPAQEAARLAAVHRYDVLDSPPDGAFERITALAARLLDVPISIVSIVDTDRIWFKSHHGVEVDQIDREPGLCASAILQDGPWLVPDARTDPRTLANPLVAGEFGLGFYAGVPLTTQDGYNLGTLCVIDRQSRTVSDEDVHNLEDLAALVMDELELRLAARRTVSLEAELRHRAEDVASTLQESLLPPQLPEVSGLEIASRYRVAQRDQVGGDFYDVMATPWDTALVVGDAVGKGTKAAALAGLARWTLRTLTLEPWTPAGALARLNLLLVRSQPMPDRYVTMAVARLAGSAGGFDLTVALGGHPRPLIVRADGSIDGIGRTDPIVGWRPDVPYNDVSSRIETGDVLVMFTDGLLEAIAGHGETDDGPIQSILRPLAGRRAPDLAAALEAALGGELRDDAAFLVVRAR